MDSQHRHDLETNALAKRLLVMYDNAKPHLQTIVLGAIGVVAAVVVGNMLWNRSQKASPGWDAYIAATQVEPVDYEALQGAADAFAGKPVGEMARITWADGRLFTGLRVYFTDKAESKKAIEEAQEAYKQLQSSKNADIAHRAEFGLARVLEAQGKVKEATAAYQSIDAGPFKQLAEVRAEELEQQDAAAAYAWLVDAQAINSGMGAGFSDQPNFQADDLGLPEAGASQGETLDDIFKRLEAIPDAPAGETPGGSDAATPPATGETPAAEGGESATEAPAAETEQPAATEGEMPAAETPPSEEPAPSTEPAEEPATEEPATEPTTEPATESATEPATEPATEEPAATESDEQ